MGIMSGLLDKANKVAEDKKEDPKQVEAVIEDRAPTGFAESDDNLPVDKESLSASGRRRYRSSRQYVLVGPNWMVIRNFC